MLRLRKIPGGVVSAARRRWGKHVTLPVRLLLLAACTPVLLFPATAKTQRAPALGPGYRFALATADRYLEALQSGDGETGMALLSDHAKQNMTAAVLSDIFSAPGPVAYEIGRGKLLRRGCYEFPVVLFGPTLASQHTRRRFSNIVILNTGNYDWAVDKLP